MADRKENCLTPSRKQQWTGFNGSWWNVRKENSLRMALLEYTAPLWRSCEADVQILKAKGRERDYSTTQTDTSPSQPTKFRAFFDISKFHWRRRILIGGDCSSQFSITIALYKLNVGLYYYVFFAGNAQSESDLERRALRFAVFYSSHSNLHVSR
jgi:hypothetical protein